MGLEFSHIADRHGAAVYMIHDGTMTQTRAMERLAEELRKKQKDAQIVLLSARDQEGERIRDFYDLSPTSFPHILIVADDDRILHAWSGPQVPSLDHLSYALSTGSGS